MHTKLVKIVMLAATLVVACRIDAHMPEGDDEHIPDHEHLIFSKAVTRLEFTDGTVVEATAIPKEPGAFEVVITQAKQKAPKVYSLLTLGIQRLDSETEVRVGGGREVLIYTHGKRCGEAWGESQKIQSVGTNGEYDPDRIQFISFSGRTCKVTVKPTASNPSPGATIWDEENKRKILVGHDNTPPDGYPPL